MTVNGEDYSGSSKPHHVTPTQAIQWSSDYSVSNTGWKICPAAPASPTAVPSSPPTEVPTSAPSSAPVASPTAAPPSPLPTGLPTSAPSQTPGDDDDDAETQHV